jgi:alkanesulfonate monooxygenase SsuD/methylene tetrahydromethanopterin reductase-like flavin-dependent oxidoreductase (luciferase family)
MASTVDVMSHGRLLFGFGAGWYEHEWRAYGYGFPDIPTRIGMFREACEIVHRMWTEAKPVFHGKYYTIDGPINEPKGVRKPHPAFWIGGGGEKVTLKLVAKYADACNLGSADLDQFRHKLDVLKRHCDDVGRDYNDIVRSTGVTVHLIQSERDAEKETARARENRSYTEYARDTIVGTPDTVVERLQRLVEAGADYFIVSIPRVAYDQEPLRQFAQEVIPRFRP